MSTAVGPPPHLLTAQGMSPHLEQCGYCITACCSHSCYPILRRVVLSISASFKLFRKIARGHYSPLFMWKEDENYSLFSDCKEDEKRLKLNFFQPFILPVKYKRFERTKVWELQE